MGKGWTTKGQRGGGWDLKRAVGGDRERFKGWNFARKRILYIIRDETTERGRLRLHRHHHRRRRRRGRRRCSRRWNLANEFAPLRLGWDIRQFPEITFSIYNQTKTAFLNGFTRVRVCRTNVSVSLSPVYEVCLKTVPGQ